MDTFLDIVPSPGFAAPINSRYSISKEGDLRVIFVGGLPLMDYHESDPAGRDVVIVQLCEHGGLTEQEVADGLGVSRSTVVRAKSKHGQGGVAALLPGKRGRKGATKIKSYKEKLMVSLARKDVPKTEIAHRLGVTESGVRKALRRLGHEDLAVRQLPLELDEHKQQEPSPQPEACDQSNGSVGSSDDSVCEHEDEAAVSDLPKEDEQCSVVASKHADTTYDEKLRGEEAAYAKGEDEETDHDTTVTILGVKKPSDVELPAEQTVDTDPGHRDMDRFFARVGLLDDGAPLFGTCHDVARAGLLLAVPILVLHGVFADAVKIFGNIGPAFYGVRNTVMSLLMMFLSRINRPEHLKEHSPWKLGAVIGLDRFPEMKTLRRKIRALSRLSKSLEFMKSLCERHLARLKGTHLWLYVDGHVSVYSGKRKLKKHHVTRLRISLPSILDYWINDGRGDPLLVVSGVPRKMMVSLIPKQITQLRELGEKRPITVVFDREGWSPEMFAKLDAMESVYFVSYRKAKANKNLPRLPIRAFSARKEEVDGKLFEYHLADNGIYVEYGKKKGARKRLHLRQVTRLSENGHQTHVVTNDWKSSAFTVGHGMFSRWGQENFFKYMGAEMALDGLFTYEMEDADGDRMVPNPERQKLGKRIKELAKKRDKLMAEYGDRALNNEEKQRRTMRGFKIANGTLAERVREIDAELEPLVVQHAALPTKVPVNQTLNGEQPKQVHVETRRLMHCFQIAAFRAESALRELIRPHYRQWRQDGRTIIQSMLQSSGDIEVGGNELRVVLEPQSAPHRTRTLATLCEDLNRLDTKFPGSDLCLRFSVRESKIAS